jgi:hypothetical protein
MATDKAKTDTQATTPKPPSIEERAIDVGTVTQVVSAGAAVVSAGAAVYAASQVNKPKK